MKKFKFCSVQFSGLLIFLLFVSLPACSQNKDDKKVGKKVVESAQSKTNIDDPEKVKALHEAALEGSTDKVKSLLREGVDFDAADEDGHTALMYAAFNGHTEVVRILLDLGANTTAIDYAGRTALMYAATGPFPETVKLLIEMKSDPNAVDKEEHFTPLMHAAAEGHLEVVKVLLENGADASMKDIDGDTAESFAIQNGHKEVAEYIKSEKLK